MAISNTDKDDGLPLRTPKAVRGIAARDAAYEHCLWAMREGMKPCDVLASIGKAHDPRCTWQNAMSALQAAWKIMNQSEKVAA